MHTLLSNQAVSMSEFKRNPAAVMREAGHRPVAVLNHNKPAFYMVEPLAFEALLDELGDRDLMALVHSRLAEMDKAIEVDVDLI